MVQNLLQCAIVHVVDHDLPLLGFSTLDVVDLRFLEEKPVGIHFVFLKRRWQVVVASELGEVVQCVLPADALSFLIL